MDNKDIYRAFALRGIWLIFKPVAWYAFFVAVLLKYVIFGEYELRLTHIPMYFAFAIIILLPIMKGWISAALDVPGFSGMVENIRTHKEVYDPHRSVTGRRGLSRDGMHITVMDVTVRDKKGKKHKFSMRDQDYIDMQYIKQGDFVIHPWGCKYLEKADKSGDEEFLCLVCGEMCRADSERCFNCRCTVQKRRVYFNPMEYKYK